MFGLFDGLTKVVKSGLNVGESLVTGDWIENGVDKDELATLIAGGLTIFVISEATGIAVDVLETVMDDGGES